MRTSELLRLLGSREARFLAWRDEQAYTGQPTSNYHDMIDGPCVAQLEEEIDERIPRRSES